MYNFDEQIERRGTSSIKYDLLKKVFGRDDLHPMWVADMDFRTAPSILKAVRDSAERGIFGYTFRSEESVDLFIEWVNKRYNWDIKKEWITSAPGIVAAIPMSIRTLTNPGDKILIQTPVYPPFYNIIKETDRELMTSSLIETEKGWEIDWSDFENKLKEGVKMFVLCSSHNPLGRIWSREELEKMGNLCVKYGVIIFSDEIHADLALFGNEHIPTASVSKEIAEITITAMSPSKTFNVAGMLNSVIIASSERLFKAYNSELVKLHLDLGNMFGHVTMEAAYRDGEDWLNAVKKYLEGNIDYAYDFLAKELPSIKFKKPQSSFLLWVDFKGTGLTHQEVKDRLINVCKLGLNDGLTFGQEGEGFFRMNIGTNLASVKEGLNRLKAGFKV